MNAFKFSAAKFSLLFSAIIIMIGTSLSAHEQTLSNTIPNRDGSINIDNEAALNVRTDVDRAMWVWSPEEIVYDVNSAKADFFAFCTNHNGTSDADAPAFSQHPINRVFLYAHGFLVSSQDEKDVLRSFIREAHARGIAVEYLDGEAAWINKDSAAANTIISDLLAFNENGATEERFDGVQFDVEPYALHGWYTAALWNQYIQFLQSTQSKLACCGSGMRFGVTIPRWYDVTLGMDALKQVFSHVDYTAVLDYVNDGAALVIDAANEISLGNDMGVKVYVGVETAHNMNPTVSFQQKGWLEMERSFSAVNSAFSSYKSFAGVAVREYTSYKSMQKSNHSIETVSSWAEADQLNSPELLHNTADIVLIDNSADNAPSVVSRQLSTLRARYTSENNNRRILANMSLVNSPKVYNEPQFLQTLKEKNNVPGGGVAITPANYFQPIWSEDMLNNASTTETSNLIKEGFDGFVVNIDEAVTTANKYDVPDMQGKVITFLQQLDKKARVEMNRKNTIIIARVSNAFMQSLSEDQYETVKSLIDGVVFTEAPNEIAQGPNFNATIAKIDAPKSDTNAPEHGTFAYAAH